MGTFRDQLSSCTCAAVLCWAGPALAQDLSSSATAQATADGANSSDQIGDIIVTAQRRAQRLQDVPITINAISGAQAAATGVTGTASLQIAVPSLVVNRQANNAAPFIRGIGITNSDPNSENSVAIYLDGVYQPSPFGNFFEFNNIERVEVLKGPQGTLFGRNSTGGVIQVITRDPTQEFKADFTAGIARFDKVTGSAYLSGGLTSNLAANISVMYDQQFDGWGKNLTTGTETFKSRSFGVRSKLLFTPDDRTTIKLAGDYSNIRNGGITGQNVPGSIAPIVNTTYPGRYNTYSDIEDFGRAKGGGASLTIEHDFDSFKILSISAYRKLTGAWRLDDDVSSVPLVLIDTKSHARTLSQELHILAPTSAKLQWLAGLYLFDHKAGYDPISATGLAFDPTFSNPLAGIDTFAETRVRSAAVFAQATYPILERTNLTLGARYTWDRVTYDGEVRATGTNIVFDPQGRLKTNAKKPTWRVSLDRKFSDTVLAYATYNRGFKSGTFSLTHGPSDNIPTRPEKLDAFEVGLKTEFLDRRVRLNLAAFHYKYSDIQLQRFVNGASLLFNGPSATINGAEAELQVRPTSRLTLGANIGVLRTRIGDFPNAPAAIRLPNGLTIDDPVPLNAKGNTLPSAPKLTGNVSAIYVVPVSFGKMTFSGNAYYNDGRYSEVDNRLRDGSYVLVDASAGWLSNDGQYGLRVWGKNLANNYYYAQLFAQPLIGDIGGPAGPPRTYGVTAELHF